MKLSIIIFSLFVSTTSFACSESAAQVIGKITKKVVYPNNECKVLISVSQHWPHSLCPLSLETVEQNLVNSSYACLLNEGEAFSGIIVEKNNELFID